MAKQIKSEIETLKSELAGYVGEKQAAHSVWMIESNLETECLKRDGKAWLLRLRNRLLERLTEPTSRRISQTSPETQAWGGFLSDTVTFVPAPSLRERAARK